MVGHPPMSHLPERFFAVLDLAGPHGPGQGRCLPGRRLALTGFVVPSCTQDEILLSTYHSSGCCRSGEILVFIVPLLPAVLVDGQSSPCLPSGLLVGGLSRSSPFSLLVQNRAEYHRFKVLSRVAWHFFVFLRKNIC